LLLLNGMGDLLDLLGALALRESLNRSVPPAARRLAAGARRLHQI